MSRCWKVRCFHAYCLLALGAVLAAGCGGESDGLNRASVSGKVTLNGMPIQEGGIAFTPSAGTVGPMAWGQIVDGEYSVDAGERGPVVGTHTVKIEGYLDQGKRDSGGAAVKEQIVPRRYNAQTTLTVEVAAGENARDFNLTTN